VVARVTKDTRKVRLADGQVSMDLPIQLRDHGDNIYRCTKCGSSNIGIDTVTPSVDPRWVLCRCNECGNNQARVYSIPSQEEPDGSGT